MKFTVLTILSVQFGSIKYICIVVQPSPSPISRTDTVDLTCKFHIFRFICSLQFVCNSKISTCSAFAVFVDMHKASESLNCPMYASPAEIQQGDDALPCFSFHTTTNALFVVCLLHGFCIFVLFVVNFAV